MNTMSHLAPAVLGMVAASLLSGCSAGRDELSRKVKNHLGEQTIAVLSRASKVESFRIDPDSPQRHDKVEGEEIGGFFVTSKGERLDADFAARLRAVLFDERTYFRPDKARCFWPGIAYRVWGEGQESVDILICFYCHNVATFANDASGIEVHQAGGSFYDAVRPELVKLAKEAFPTDAKVQRLKNEHDTETDLLRP